METIYQNGRKILENEENPIDNMLIAIADKLCPIFKTFNFTANGITTMSLIFSCVAIYYLIIRDVYQFTIYYSIAYFFDVMDGYYARKYKQFSEFGDRYDHYKDLIVGTVIVYILYDKYEITQYPILIIIMIALGIMMMIYIGCQEELTDKEIRSDILKNYSTISKESCMENMKIFRLFGPGSFHIMTILLVWYLDHRYMDKHMIDIISK